MGATDKYAGGSSSPGELAQQKDEKNVARDALLLEIQLSYLRCEMTPDRMREVGKM